MLLPDPFNPLLSALQVCIECSPRREYIRLFDVTENTGVRKHRTGRNCHKCKCELRDTIVHFGEKGGMQSPQNWEEAAEAAQEADTILCLGSTLKVGGSMCIDRPQYLGE